MKESFNLLMRPKIKRKPVSLLTGQQQIQMKNQNKQPEVASLGSRTRYAEATTNKDNKKPVNQ